MIPKQKHGKGRGKKGKCSTDKSQAHISSVKGTKSNRPDGSEGSVTTSPRMTKPQGTTIAAKGGRNSRAKTYG